MFVNVGAPQEFRKDLLFVRCAHVMAWPVGLVGLHGVQCAMCRNHKTFQTLFSAREIPRMGKKGFSDNLECFHSSPLPPHNMWYAFNVNPKE